MQVPPKLTTGKVNKRNIIQSICWTCGNGSWEWFERLPDLNGTYEDAEDCLILMAVLDR
jgi:hypothetical protein